MVITSGTEVPEERVAPAEVLRKLPSYLPWVDVLRFLACFMVIVLHVCPGAPVGLGHAGVALFFTISGFLICRGLLSYQPLPTFYARRFLRIYPAYFATVLLLAGLSFTPFMHNAGNGRLFRDNLQYYLTFTFQLSPDKAVLPLIIVWSLCVEELFYLFIPFLFLMSNRRAISVALWVLIAVLMIPKLFLLPDGSGTWFLFPLNLFSGALLALAQPRLRFDPPVIGLVALAVLLANAFGGWFHNFGPVSAILCTATVWSFASYDRQPGRPFSPFLWMGKLSYGMYLLHLFCFSIALRCLRSLSGHAAVYYALLILLTTGASAVAAWCMQVSIEEPALRLRPSLVQQPMLRYGLAAIQVSFIPVGILLAILRQRGH